MRAKQLETIAHLLDTLAQGRDTSEYDERARNDWRILAEDARREAQDASGWETIETLIAERVIGNDQAFDNERTRVILRAAAKAEDPETSDVDAADALRDWLRDDVITLITEGARFRAERQIGRQDSRTGTPPKSRELASGYEDFAHAMARCACNGIDWLSMAREVLDCHGGEDTLRDHVEVMRALLASYPDPSESVGECNAYRVEGELAEQPEGKVIDVLAILHDLSRKGLVSDRYVGGVSGHLFAPVEG